jgi:hypothetical protein
MRFLILGGGARAKVDGQLVPHLSLERCLPGFADERGRSQVRLEFDLLRNETENVGWEGVSWRVH